jgi:hypothetical protein
VARRRPPRAMRPHRAVRIARVTVPAARVTPLAGVTGANTPADDARAAYPAAFGLKPDTIRIHRAVCRRYPQVKTPCFMCASGGDHGEGRALVYMISGSTAGWDIAKWVANAKSLGVSEIIQRQHLWQRSSEGWRPMSDRSSPTANQMTTYTAWSTATAAPSS